MPSSSRGPVQSALALACFFALCFAIAWFGVHSAAPYMRTWYSGLVKPWFTPPTWTFGPTVVFLYSTMAIAAWLIWKMPRRRARSNTYQGTNDTQGSARLDALIVFYMQLFFNSLWIPLVFHYHRLLVSVVVILALWIALFFTVLLFWRVKPVAGMLLLPYMAMVTFGIALNLALLHLN